MAEGDGEERRRLEAEKETVAEILGGGVGGFGREDEGIGVFDGDEEEEVVGVLGLGAKKREMTCCFCFPMVAVALDVPKC